MLSSPLETRTKRKIDYELSLKKEQHVIRCRIIQLFAYVLNDELSPENEEQM